MADAGEIKAKVIITYDGSGVDKAKRDLEELGALGGTVEAGANKASDGLAGLEDQTKQTAASTEGLNTALEKTSKPTEALTTAVSEVNDRLADTQTIAEDTGQAFQALHEPIQKTTALIGDTSTAIPLLSKQAESLHSALENAGGGFAQVQSVMEETMPMLQPYVEHMQRLQQMASFFSDHPLLPAPAPEAMQALEEMPKIVEGSIQAINDAVEATPTWREQFGFGSDMQLQFDKSGRIIGAGAEQIESHFAQMGAAANTAQGNFSNFTEAAQGTGQALTQNVTPAATEATKSTQNINTQLNDLNDTASKTTQKLNESGTAFSANAANAKDFTSQVKGAINEFGGVGNAMYGPMPKMAESIGFGEAFGNAGKGLIGMLNDVAMPLMAVQMIGMAVQATGKAIYDSAVLVEGKAAHSYGTFTGTVDALGQSVQNLGGQFSESFGQAIIPTMNVLNAQFSDQGGIAKFLGDSAGGALGILFNLGQIASGINPMGGIAGLESMFGVDTGIAGAMPISANPLQKQIDQFYQQANDPQYLAAQAYYGSAMAKAQKNQASWDTSHYAGTTGPLDPMNEILQAQAVRANGGVYGHVPEDPNLAWLDDLGNPGPGGYAEFYNGRGNGSSGNSSSFQASPGGGAAYMNNDAGDTQQTSVMDTWFPGLREGYSNIVAPKVLSDQQMKGMQDFFGGIGNGIGGFFGGVGDAFGGLFNMLNFNLGDSESLGSMSSSGGGCFPAGTPVLLANGTTKPIEQIQIGDYVLAHNGKKRVATPVLARIVPPPKKVYELVFSDGTLLKLTDSHPISTLAGWKSISPPATALENPNLEVAPLEVGDIIYTVNGTCVLVDMYRLPGIVQVYNVEVAEPHTFYAGGILVHNKTTRASIGQQASEQIGDIQLPPMNLSGMAGQLGGAFSGVSLPHMDLSGMSAGLGGAFSGMSLPHMDLSGMASGLGGAFSGISLPHMDLSGMAAGLGGAFSGISLPHIDMSGITGSLAGAFSGITMPPIPAIGSEISGALGGMFSGITMPPMPAIGSEISGALGGMFSGISMPAIPDIGSSISGALSGMFSGISVPTPPQVGGMISGAMSGLFGGISVPTPPQVGGMINGAMSGLFGGISVPSPPNVAGMINGAMSSMFSGIVMPSIPFFADGVSNFSGGAAVVGEAGTEVAEYNGHYALFDQGAAFVNLPAGASVYTMKDMAAYSSPHMMANGTGEDMAPRMLGASGGASFVINITHITQLDGRTIMKESTQHLATAARQLAGGKR